MKISAIIAACVATAIALPVEKTDTETSPNPGRLEARVVADFFNYIAAKELTPTIPTCCDATPLAAYSSNQDCRFISNMDMARGPDEPILSFCYGAGDGGMLFTEEDAKVAKCLTDLHYRQPDKCISVKGSRCEPGYHGRIQNMVKSTGGIFTKNGQKLTGEQSIWFQKMMDAMVGNQWSTDGLRQQWVESKKDGATVNGVYLRYIGENEC